MLDSVAVDQLTALAASGKTLRDVPLHLVRKPGINFAVIVPESPTVVAKEVAHRVEDRMRSLWKTLGGQDEQRKFR